jgi:hypothetical protein
MRRTHYMETARIVKKLHLPRTHLDTSPAEATLLAARLTTNQPFKETSCHLSTCRCRNC